MAHRMVTELVSMEPMKVSRTMALTWSLVKRSVPSLPETV